MHHESVNGLLFKVSVWTGKFKNVDEIKLKPKYVVVQLLLSPEFLKYFRTKLPGLVFLERVSQCRNPQNHISIREQRVFLNSHGAAARSGDMDSTAHFELHRLRSFTLKYYSKMSVLHAEDKDCWNRLWEGLLWKQKQTQNICSGNENNLSRFISSSPVIYLQLIKSTPFSKYSCPWRHF